MDDKAKAVALDIAKDLDGELAAVSSRSCAAAAKPAHSALMRRRPSQD